ncbi:hypothetical protein [uncultured Modestobacter sp.]|uniref:hypothetical protein n=1 Tax=uncultured Modestobacter sp. TaxID=380048 RepID=UPI00260AEEBE|nr:hypothetical protein [uncultured Modestobacter sp.]
MELFAFLVLLVLVFRTLGRGSRSEVRPAGPRTDTWVDVVVEGPVRLATDVGRGVATLTRLDAARRERQGRSPWS